MIEPRVLKPSRKRNVGRVLFSLLPGRVAHDVPWIDVVQLLPVSVNAYSFVVVAFVCAPRRAKHGRWRWRRGTEHDDGCMPDTYGMDAVELIGLMREHASSAAPRRPAGAQSLQAF